MSSENEKYFEGVLKGLRNPSKEFLELMASMRKVWESEKREREALMEAVKLEDACVEGKNCTTQKQRDAARREYRRHQRILARQRQAEQILKV
jgi:hypothetical protein